MFCKNCGKEISDGAVVCPYCGVQVGNFAEKKTNTLAVVGFVFAFIFPIVGLICSIIARKKCREEGLEGDELALAGIIISAVCTVILIAFAGFYAFFIYSLALPINR